MRRFAFLSISILIILLPFVTASFAQDSLNVRRLAAVGVLGYDVGISGDRAYVCSWANGLSLIDISQLDTLIYLDIYYPPC